ncbi:hypothetical protein WZ342_2628 [Enterococcus faecalis]|nr:hypothetical protein WZ342_2628 [Enterococcus faecalis]
MLVEFVNVLKVATCRLVLCKFCYRVLIIFKSRFYIYFKQSDCGLN